MDSRTCGACTACCTALGVTDLPVPKPDWTPCKHLCGAGCGVYARRPGSCREYQCLWRGGVGDENERPDVLGLIFEPWEPPDGDDLGTIVRETIPGAFERFIGSGTALAAIVASAPAYVVLPSGDRRLCGPPERLRRIWAAVEAKKARRRA